jgi:hypothetical protein
VGTKRQGDNVATAVAPEPELDRPDDGTEAGTPHYLLAALSASAGVVHLAMVPSHAADELWHGLAFAAAGWFQLIWAVLAVTRPGRRLLMAGAAANAAFVGVWIVSRTVGLPGGEHSMHPEEVTSIDLMTSAFEVALVIGAIVMLVRPVEVARKGIGAFAAIASVLVLGATTVALASPDARHDHHGGHGEVATGAHDHGEGHEGDHGADHGEMHEHADGEQHDHGAEAALASDEERCDLELNTAAYYRDAELAGVNEDSSAHEHASTTDSGEGHDEGESAAQIVALAGMSQEEYDVWLANDAAATRNPMAPDDTGAGGHSGPQPWEPITDPEVCDTLAAELDLARETALSFPTPVEARAAGYTMVTGYVPGIASHWMNFSLIDDKFEVDKPEMLLYDGTGDSAHMIGLSYYIVNLSETEPTQGFTGDNDHYHRHKGLCVRGTTVIGGSGTTEEECAARGGRKQNGSGGWMSHAWVVPGCESPWGVFSAENPKLDPGVGAQTGQGTPCSGTTRAWDDTPGRPIEGTGSEEQAAGG